MTSNTFDRVVGCGRRWKRFISAIPCAVVAALTVLSGVQQVNASAYTIEANYYLLDGKLYSSNGFESHDIAVSLPTLAAGDTINTTINFTRGLALRINDPGPGIQLLGATFYPNNSANDVIVKVSNQLSLLLAHGELLTPDVVTGQSHCNTCVSGQVSRNFADSSFSFRGFSIVTTILDIPEPFGSYRMAFRAYTSAGDIEIVHGASPNPVPLPFALPLFASGLTALGLVGWLKKRPRFNLSPKAEGGVCA